MRLSLYNTPQFTELITICVNGLTDNQTEVNDSIDYNKTYLLFYRFEIKQESLYPVWL